MNSSEWFKQAMRLAVRADDTMVCWTLSLAPEKCKIEKVPKKDEWVCYYIDYDRSFSFGLREIRSVFFGSKTVIVCLEEGYE